MITKQLQCPADYQVTFDLRRCLDVWQDCEDKKPNTRNLDKLEELLSLQERCIALGALSLMIRFEGL